MSLAEYCLDKVFWLMQLIHKTTFFVGMPATLALLAMYMFPIPFTKSHLDVLLHFSTTIGLVCQSVSLYLGHFMIQDMKSKESARKKKGGSNDALVTMDCGSGYY